MLPEKVLNKPNATMEVRDFRAQVLDVRPRAMEERVGGIAQVSAGSLAAAAVNAVTMLLASGIGRVSEMFAKLA